MKGQRRVNNSGKLSKFGKLVDLFKCGAEIPVNSSFGSKILCICALIYFMVFISSTAYSGSIKGRVHIIGGPTDGNAVVYIEKINQKFTPPDSPVVMNQKNLMFTPEVLPVLAGTAVRFVNSDVVLHDVFSPSPCSGQFDLGLFPGGQSRVHVFEHAGCAAIILCDVHPEMQAWVVVLQNPYYAVTKDDGEYIIKNIPAGTYTLKAWYNYYGVQSVRVSVPESGEIEVNFQLKP